MALTDEVSERAGGAPKPIIKHVLRPRTMLYTALWSLVGVGLVFALFIRQDIEMSVAPIRNPTFGTLSDGSIRNTYDLRIRNKHGEERPFRIGVTGDPALRLQVEGTPYATVTVPADTAGQERVYVIAPGGSAPARAEATDVRIWIEDTSNGDRAYRDTVFNGRGQ